MPTRAPTHQPRSEALVKNARRDHDRRRGSPSSRGYGRRWAQLARMFKRHYPVCADPFGVHAASGEVVPATQVDHIVPRRLGGTDAWSNLQSLCASCHSRKTARQDGGFGNLPPDRQDETAAKG